MISCTVLIKIELIDSLSSPLHKAGLLSVLANLTTLEEDFPDVYESPLIEGNSLACPALK
jgi:hypothetical protein